MRIHNICISLDLLFLHADAIEAFLELVDVSDTFKEL